MDKHYTLLLGSWLPPATMQSIHVSEAMSRLKYASLSSSTRYVLGSAGYHLIWHYPCQRLAAEPALVHPVFAEIAEIHSSVLDFPVSVSRSLLTSGILSAVEPIIPERTLSGVMRCASF